IPDAGAGISASTLSVEISKRGSSRCTLSPGFFSHLVMVPSKIDSPIWGMTISVGIDPFYAARFRPAQPHIIYIGQANLAPAQSLVVVPVLFPLGIDSGRREPGGLFPIILHRGGQFLDARQEGGNFPHVLLTQSLVPGGHAGIANAGANGVVDMPLGIIQRIADELWGRRVKRALERIGLVVEPSVTKGAVHGVDFHSVDQIVVSRRHGAGYP